MRRVATQMSKVCAHHRKALCIRRGTLSKINYAQRSYNTG